MLEESRLVRRRLAVGTNPAYNTPPGVGNGLPNYVVAPNAKIPTSENGVISPCLNARCVASLGDVGAPLTFNADGTTVSPFDPGRFGGAFSRIGGDGKLLGYDISNIRPDIERYSALGHFDWNLSDSLKLSFELANAHSESENFPANGAIGPLGIHIQPDNAFLTPAVKAALGPFGGSYSRVFAPDVLSARNTTKADTLRFVTAVQGNLTDNWDWDAYYEHGRSNYEQRLFHNVVGGVVGTPALYNFIGWAVDAVHSNPNDPTSPIVCRATIPGSPTFSQLAVDTGCVPLNFFGVTNADPAALDYVFRTLKEDNEYKQDVIGANFRADLAKGWAGPIAGAFGFEWRKDQSEATHDLANQPWYSNYFLTWGLDRGGKIDVAEVYGEVQVPLAKKLQSDWSVRETRNEATSDAPGSDTKSHDFASWKAALTYDALDWLRIRTTRSRDVRAAGFRELFLPRVSTIGTQGGFPGAINNPWNGNRPESYLSISGGNPDLEPEKADTTAFGTVFSFDRFQFSIDWYEIDLKDAITPGGTGGLSAQQVVDACFAGGSKACGAVVGAGTSDIVSVDSSSINIGEFVTRGYDLEARYNVPLQAGSNLNLRVIASYLYDMIIDTGLGNPPVNYHGQSGPVASFGGFNTSPDWQATAWVTYARPRFTTTFETRYIGPGTLNALRFDSPPGSPTNTLLNSITDNSVDSRIYLGWSGSYDFKPQGSGSQLQVFWAINNLLDKDPPVAPGGNFYPTNPVFFDTLGRRYRAGVRLQF